VIYLQLFLSFLQVGMFSIGGGYAAMPLIQAQVVTSHGWLTMNEFTDLITIAEMTPGPIAVNSSTFVGIRIAGIPGALVATFGCILPSCIIVSLLAFIYYRYKNVSALQNVLASLRPAVVALIAAAGLSILQMVAFQGNKMQLQNVNWAGLAIFAAAFVVLRKLKWNPILVMCLCGAAGLIVHLVLQAL
jgi:chromate transporter